MKCPKCNSEIANDSKFCEHCGAQMTNGGPQPKRVDIRWCLLPAMIIASFAFLLSVLDGKSFINYHDFDFLVLTLAPVMLLLFITVVLGLIKAVPPSFVVLMLLLTATDATFTYIASEEYDLYNCREYVDLYWTDVSGEYQHVKLERDKQCSCYETSDKQLLEVQELVCKALKKQGVKSINPAEYSSEESNYCVSDDYVILFVVVNIGLLFIYGIYAFIGHRIPLKKERR